MTFSVVVRHVRLRVARPRHAEPAEAASDLLDARPIVGERVVVEEDLLNLRECVAVQFTSSDHVADGAGAVVVAADRLRPQAEGAARPAAAARVERDVRVLQVADEVVLDLQVALVDRRHARQLVHVLEQWRAAGCA